METIKELLKIDPDAKVIVSSGYSNDMVMTEYEKYGFSGIAVKPYEFGDLHKTINGLISSHS